jgi:hypothetical protein
MNTKQSIKYKKQVFCIPDFCYTILKVNETKALLLSMTEKKLQ